MAELRPFHLMHFIGGVEGRWRKFSNATVEDWRRAAAMIRTKGGVE